MAGAQLESGNNFMYKLIITIIVIMALSGCQPLGHKQFYNQVAPTKYPVTANVMIFEYSNVDLDEIYELFFSDYLVIGRSDFDGPYEDPKKSKSYAKSIGADILIASSQFKETRTSFMNVSTPTTNTTYISGYNGRDSTYRTATTYGTHITTIPVQVNRYAQSSMFLKNINNVNSLWQRTKDQYQQTANNELSGLWRNESYQIEIFQSGDQMVAFIENVLQGDGSWSTGQLKMIFGRESGVGIYLTSNKTPMPANFLVNKFGHLEVTLSTNSETFSFAKMP